MVTFIYCLQVCRPADQHSAFKASAYPLPACGDLRNVMKSITGLPICEDRKILVAINDLDFDICARNAIMLLIILTADDEAEAANCVLHLWYSALIKRDHLDILITRIKPLIQDVVDKIASKTPHSLQAKTWSFGRRSLRLVLPKEKWIDMLACFRVPEGLDAQQASSLRTRVTLAAERIDYRHRSWMLKQPYARFSDHYFRSDGVLLPISHPRKEFIIPNPSVPFFPSKIVGSC